MLDSRFSPPGWYYDPPSDDPRIEARQERALADADGELCGECGGLTRAMPDDDGNLVVTCNVEQPNGDVDCGWSRTEEFA